MAHHQTKRSPFFFSSPMVPERDANADGPSELNCNGHAGLERRLPPWREGDQHNGNAAQKQEPAFLNGLDCADLKEQLHPDLEGPPCSGASAGRFSGRLEEEEEPGEHLCRERGDDDDGSEEMLQNGQAPFTPPCSFSRSDWVFRLLPLSLSLSFAPI